MHNVVGNGEVEGCWIRYVLTAVSAWAFPNYSLRKSSANSIPFSTEVGPDQSPIYGISSGILGLQHCLTPEVAPSRCSVWGICTGMRRLSHFVTTRLPRSERGREAKVPTWSCELIGSWTWKSGIFLSKALVDGGKGLVLVHREPELVGIADERQIGRPVELEGEGHLLHLNRDISWL